MTPRHDKWRFVVRIQTVETLVPVDLSLINSPDSNGRVVHSANFARMPMGGVQGEGGAEGAEIPAKEAKIKDPGRDQKPPVQRQTPIPL